MTLPTKTPPVVFTIEDLAADDSVTIELVSLHGRIIGDFDRFMGGTALAIMQGGLIDVFEYDPVIEPTSQVLEFESSPLLWNVSTTASNAIGGSYEYIARLRLSTMPDGELVEVRFPFQLNEDTAYTLDTDGRITFAQVDSESISITLPAVLSTPGAILSDLKTVDGEGSGLDADLLDGLHASEIIAAASSGGGGGGGGTGDMLAATYDAAGKGEQVLTVGDLGDTVQDQSDVLDNTTASFTTAQQSKLAATDSSAVAASSDGTLAGASSTVPPSQSAVIAYLATEIANIIGTAPDALNALGEIAASLDDDADFAGTMTAALAAKAAIVDVVLKTLYDANTIIAADTDNAPAPLTVGEQTIVGRITGGNIAALTPAQIRTLIGLVIGDTVQAHSSTLDDTTAAFTTALESAIGVNNAKTSNATHTGEVIGSGALTLDKTAITSKGLVTADPADHLLIADASDSDELKRVPVSDMLDAETNPWIETGHIPHETGYGFIPGMLGGTAQEADATLVADRMYYTPMAPHKDVTIDGITVDISGVGGSPGTVLRVGVVELDPDDWQPTATGLVGQTTVDPSSTGNKTVTGLSWTFEAGKLYAMLLVCDGNPNIESVGNVAQGTIRQWLRFSGNSLTRLSYFERDGQGTGVLSDPVPDTTSAVLADGHRYFWGFTL